MSWLRRRLTGRLARLRRDERGAVTAEFVIIFPVFMTLLLMGVESGLMLTRQVLLDRAVDIAVRDLRLGHMNNATHDQLKTRICDRTVMIRNCHQTLLLELRRISMTTWDYPTAPPACIDRTEEIAPVTEPTYGGANDLMLIRACAIVDPLFPTTRYGLGLRLDASGGFQLFALSTFVNEPR